jgi:hypothetical protein
MKAAPSLKKLSSAAKTKSYIKTSNLVKIKSARKQVSNAYQLDRSPRYIKESELT